jgi:hypothetical protein
MNAASQAIYRQNRSKWSLDALRQYDGQWVAFSADGQQIVAGAATISELADRLRELRQDMGDVALEFIDLEPMTIHLGGAEWQ